MQRISEVAEQGIKIIVGVLLIILSANVFFQIISRQVIRFQCVWTDEIARFSFIWLTMLGASLQVKYNAHYAVSIFLHVVKNKVFITVVIYFLMLIVSVCFVIYGIDYSRIGINKLSTSAGIRMVWIYAAIPVGGLFMVFFLCEKIFNELVGNGHDNSTEDK